MIEKTASTDKITKRSLSSILPCLAVLLPILSSCDRFTGWKSGRWSHYATGFFLSKELLLEYDEDGVIEVVPQVSGDAESPELHKLITVNDLILDKQLRSQMESLAATFPEGQHPSVTYEGFTEPYCTFCMETPIRYFLTTPIDDVDVTSDLDWGEEYPSGTSLDEVIWFAGRFHDQYAKTLEKPEVKPLPDDFAVGSDSFMKEVRWIYDRATRDRASEFWGFYEPILLPLSEVNFASMDYFTPEFFLSSDAPHFSEPQQLTIRITFRDGDVRVLKVRIRQDD